MPTIIDLNARFGAYPARHRTTTFAQVAEDASTLGVGLSCVCATTGIFFSDREGNLETVRAAASDPGKLVPVATLNPATTLDPAGAIDEIARGPFKMVRFFPVDQDWPIDFAPFARCVSLLATRRIPAMISCSKRGEATHISRLIAAGASNLPVILEGVSAHNLAEVIEVMTENASIYLETHSVTFADGLHMLRDVVGADRMVFGSGASALSLGAALSYVNGSDLSDEDKRKVLGGNAARLLNLS